MVFDFFHLHAAHDHDATAFVWGLGHKANCAEDHATCLKQTEPAAAQCADKLSEDNLNCTQKEGGMLLKCKNAHDKRMLNCSRQKGEAAIKTCETKSNATFERCKADDVAVLKKCYTTAANAHFHCKETPIMAKVKCRTAKRICVYAQSSKASAQAIPYVPPTNGAPAVAAAGTTSAAN